MKWDLEQEKDMWRGPRRCRSPRRLSKLMSINNIIDDNEVHSLSEKSLSFEPQPKSVTITIIHNGDEKLSGMQALCDLK